MKQGEAPLPAISRLSYSSFSLATWFVHGYVNFAAACRSTVMDVHKKLVQGQEKYF